MNMNNNNQCAEELEKYISITEIFNQVLKYYGWDENNQDENNQDDIEIESKKRNMRNKYDFFMKKVLFRNARNFKNKGKNMILKVDAPIIRELIILALKEDKKDPVVNWFNGKFNTKEPEKAYIIYGYLEEVIRKLELKGEIDCVTADEWLRALSCSIHYNTAYNRVKLSHEFDEFINCTLGINYDIDLGSVISESCGEYRTKIGTDHHCHIDMENKTLRENLENVTCQDDYLTILKDVINIMNDHARNSIVDKIKFFAKVKCLFNLDKADELLYTQSFASEYVIWFQNIYEFLNTNPNILEEIEKETGTDNLLDFFKMNDR